ncbi:MAG: hypothetical protein R3Y21_01825 [Mycoplasmatota bacterium]
MNNVSKRLKEVYVILKYVDKVKYKKIPDSLICYIETNMDKDYQWDFDVNKKLCNQGLDVVTIEMLTYINSNYFIED